MAVSFNATTTEVNSAFASHATQRTYSIWTYRVGNGESGLGRLFDKRDAGAQVELLFHGGGAGVEYVYERDFSGDNGSWFFAQPSANTWVHVLVTYDSSDVANDPVMYYDGSSQSQTGSTTPTGTADTNTDVYVVGNRGAQDRTWDGYLCEFAIWDRILTTGEIASLSKGFSPAFFQNSLVEYLPTVREAISYKVAAPTFVNTSIVAHPRIIYPSPAQIRRFGVAGAPATVVKDPISPGIIAFPR